MLAPGRVNAAGGDEAGTGDGRHIRRIGEEQPAEGGRGDDLQIIEWRDDGDWRLERRRHEQLAETAREATGDDQGITSPVVRLPEERHGEAAGDDPGHGEPKDDGRDMFAALQV